MLIPINYEIQERSNDLYESIIVAEESDHIICVKMGMKVSDKTYDINTFLFHNEQSNIKLLQYQWRYIGCS